MKRWTPSIWASKKPFGFGSVRPNNYFEIWKAIWENKRHPRYAWRILRDGTCDGCALGTKGLRDWTLPEVHLCNIRLRLLRLNTMDALDHRVLEDVEPLRKLSSRELRELGRLPYPMVRVRGERGFRRVSWDHALDLVAQRIRTSGADRLGVYLTSRGMPNESYYAAQKAVRAMGTNSIDNAARVCHSPSTFGLKEALGVAATTCSYTDWIGSDLVVFVGSNIANNQPVAMKYLHHARKAGTKVVCVNPYREPGMERYWVPSNLESAIFGTKMAERFFQIAVGGDVAFLLGSLKHMIDRGWHDASFVDAHTEGFGPLRAHLEALDWEQLERSSGVPRGEMHDFARLLHEVSTAVFVWSMGVTQHSNGEDNVRALIDIALAKGFVGRAKCGLMPIRGHSGVQGGAEMGAYATALPGGTPISEEGVAELSAAWGFDVPAGLGRTAPEMIDAALAGELDVLVACGGNFLEVLPEPQRVEQALARVPMRVHMDLVVTTQMLLDPSDTVVLLPASTRYEIAGGVTETSTERRIIFSPEIRGPRPGEARAEWDVLPDLAARVRPELAERVRFASTAAVREEIARVVPLYAGIETLRRKGDNVQYGGAMLCEGWRFPTADGKAHFSVVQPPEPTVPDGAFVVATRRGKQFNSMVHERRDALNGADRDAVLMNPRDAEALGVRDGDPIRLRSEVGAMAGRVCVVPIAPRMLEVHWPEGNVLIDRRRRSPQSGIPDYNAVVTVERA